MKKFLLFFLLAPCILLGDCFTAEVRAGYFYPASKLMRKIYQNGGPEFEVEASAQVFNDFSLWVNYNSFRRNGHSIGLRERTNLRLYPISFGLKFTQPLTECLAAYIGAGASYSTLKIDDKSDFIDRPLHRYSWGGVGKAGLLFFLTENIYLDVYADYYYTKVSFAGKSLNIGGLRSGIGAGVSY